MRIFSIYVAEVVVVVIGRECLVPTFLHAWCESCARLSLMLLLFDTAS